MGWLFHHERWKNVAIGDKKTNQVTEPLFECHLLIFHNHIIQLQWSVRSVFFIDGYVVIGYHKI